MTQLSCLLKIDKTTATKVVQKLIKEGFLIKTKDKADKRSHHLYPSSQSLDIYKEIIKEENKTIEICFKDFYEAQIESVYELIKKMRKNMEEDWYEIKKV